MNAPPFPVNPPVGTVHGNWTWNGQMWVSSATTGIAVLTTVFTASGPYMPSPGLVSLKVRCIGGGGGSGSAGPVPSLQYLLGGGGGGSGGYSEKTLPAALVLGGVQITIGAGGTAGGAGASPGQIINGTGGNGAATSFGALCVANGGSGGLGNNANQMNGQNGDAGAGGVVGVGDIAFPGGDGTPGTYSYMQAAQTGGAFGAGRGGSVFGTGVKAFIGWAGQWANGTPGHPNTGQGASGAFISEAGGGPLEGANGAAGICIVDEYVWADAETGECVNPPINVNARVAVTHVPWQGPGPCPPGWGAREQLEFEGE